MIQISRDKRWQYVWLAVGAILYTFSSGRWNIPLTAWLWPLFILNFVRNQKPVRGLLLTSLVLMIGANIKWMGLFEEAFYMNVTIYALMGLIFIIPFLIDKLLSHRLSGILSTLVFPLAWTVLDYIYSFGISGSWGSIAYTQQGNLPLTQVVSVTGTFGLTFLIAWFASAANYVWNQNFEWGKIRKIICLYTGVITAVLILGGARLAFFPVDSEIVRVASVNGPSQKDFGSRSESVGTDKSIESMESTVNQAVLAGAKIINWSEEGFTLMKEDEQTFIDHACQVAKEKKVYLLLTLDLRDSDPNGLSENKEVFINPSGEVEWHYTKTHLVPIIESPYYIPGNGNIQFSDTPYGRISSVICFDANYPSYIQKAGSAGVDILFVPSWDWLEILPYHTPAVTFRAIENGTSLIRNTYDGLTMAVDYHGDTLTSVNYFKTDQKSIVVLSDVPTKGIKTVFSVIGDLFNWLCCLGLIVTAAWAIYGKKKAIE